MATYTLYERGDGTSTYEECWGQLARSRGREIARGSLVELLAHLPSHGHIAVYDAAGLEIACDRDEFFLAARREMPTLPPVAQLVAHAAALRERREEIARRTR